MAIKKYGYYIKGNRIALIEQTNETSSGGRSTVAHCSGVASASSYTTKDTCEAAGGQWIPSSSVGNSNNSVYASPTESVIKGLEIQYTYSPTFNLQSTGMEGTDFHRFLGWGSDGTNLLLFTYGASAVSNLSSLFAVDNWIYVGGSGRWSGLHQVKSTGGTTGVLTLKTKCNLKPSYITASVNFVAKTSTASGYLTGQAANYTMDIEAWKDLNPSRGTYYVFIDATEDPENTGLFEVSYPSTSGQVNFTNKITIDADGDYTSTEEGIAAETNDGIKIYNAFYEQLSVYEGVEVLQDESFELDISRYQANAVVYYLKAKMAEDAGDMDKREFFLREFKRQVEKGNSSLKRGPYIVQGFKEMR